MNKVILIISSIMASFSFPGNEEGGENTLTSSISLCFDQGVLAYESGQPVYPLGTKVLLVSSGSNLEDMQVQVNDQAKMSSISNLVNISSFTHCDPETYTVVVKTVDSSGSESEETFGFTLR